MGRTVDEGRVQVVLLYDRNRFHVRCLERETLAAKAAAYGVFDVGQWTRRVFLQEGDALSNALDAVLVQFHLRWRDGVEHVLHIGVIEQRSMNNAVAWEVVEGVAGNLASINEHIVVLGTGGGQAKILKNLANHFHVIGKSGYDFVGTGDVAHHHIRHIGIDATTAALAPVELNAVLAAIVQIHLVLYDLVAAENHRGFHLPEEENIILQLQLSGGIFLHRQIEAQATDLVGRKCQIRHKLVEALIAGANILLFCERAAYEMLSKSTS